jgi:hypothetical protein
VPFSAKRPLVLLERLLAAPAEARVADLMDLDPPVFAMAADGPSADCTGRQRHAGASPAALSSPYPRGHGRSPTARAVTVDARLVRTLAVAAAIGAAGIDGPDGEPTAPGVVWVDGERASSSSPSPRSRSTWHPGRSP